MAACLCFSEVQAVDFYRQLANAQNRQIQALQGEMAGYAAQQRSMLIPNGQNPTMQELSPTRTVVFVSRGMPEPSLLNLLKQGAGRKDVVFAFRGWGDGPVTDMFRYSQSLMKKLPANVQKNPPQIIVMPAAFRTYRINYVPAVLHMDQDRKWYLLQGMQSLDSAIEQIRARRFNERVSPQYRVSEPDQAEVMKRKMARKDKKAMIEAARKGVNQLLEGSLQLPANTAYHTYHYMPYVAAGADIVNPRNGKVLYVKGTRFNVLALDPEGHRALVVIDGRSHWQVEFARALVRNKPDTVVLYTRLGLLSEANLAASPLDAAMKDRLRVGGVPTYYRQNGLAFDVIAVKPKD